MRPDSHADALVYLSQSLSILEAPDAMSLLKAHGLTAVPQIPDGRLADVQAIILGVKPFGLSEAARFSQLKTVARFGAGYDNVDVDALWKSRGISVSYTPGVSSHEVAEFALAMTILTLRGAGRDIVGLVSGRHAWRYIARGKSLTDATVGVIGCGPIGLQYARLVAAHGAQVLLWNRSARRIELPGIDPARYRVVDHLEQIAARCDVASVHVALSEETRGLIGRSFFAQAAAGGHSLALVNTARGSIVDEEALLAALDQGSVSSAAVDVWSLEGPDPSPVVERLRRHEGVLPSTHIGAFTVGVQQRCGMQVAHNILAALGRGDASIRAHIAAPARPRAEAQSTLS